MGKKDKEKDYGLNVDFNSYGLRPPGAYLSDILKKIDPTDMSEFKSVKERSDLTRSLDDAQRAADEMLRELAKEDVLTPSAPKTQAEQAPETPDLDELLKELDELVGLERIKKNVRSLINLAKVRKLRQEQDLPVPAMSLHLVFMGNPGTGKTTVARLIAQLYCAIGVLSKGQLVEVDRSGLVAGFVGQTAIKTQEAINKALGGVLFIDEAYALTSKDGTNDFGHEAVETILKAMEDHRDDFVVIVAGYEELMEQFIDSNPGLESRFNRYFVFEDYNGDELFRIFSFMCSKNSYKLDGEAEEYARNHLNELFEGRDENFGNARDVRNFFENMISAHSDRVAEIESPEMEDLITVKREDLEKASML